MNTHDSDFYTWTQEQAALLRSGRLAELDIANLIEEVEDMGRSERRELENRLAVLLAHLLKWQYQPEYRGNSWQATIKGQRNRTLRLLKKNPGLKTEISESLSDAYDDARYEAAKETGLNVEIFPGACPWSFPQAIDNNFWPEDK